MVKFLVSLSLQGEIVYHLRLNYQLRIGAGPFEAHKVISGECEGKPSIPKWLTLSKNWLGFLIIRIKLIRKINKLLVERKKEGIEINKVIIL